MLTSNIENLVEFVGDSKIIDSDYRSQLHVLLDAEFAGGDHFGARDIALSPMVRLSVVRIVRPRLPYYSQHHESQLIKTQTSEIFTYASVLGSLRTKELM